ncbi:bifunctional 2-polyprenyl-6-hydroxyphenol methylase/3-demethylubiquinol 3-O-methyltransferase UbiG [Acuticoccus sp. I52.16.1]|uniref:bifunctional 2-polyprenyl-6-hydroxyphenol methylase/3-demethylubiquinol 3-O-methyltransferase UbiG n=1 Tax=Acuticoccus sp. I52.16.1 TaxID=2928472 RepID=UPI001FD10730|nr:bifunctional 2-polyprenyl-6-hydroxyphenol methylase/3-demethylubiquinol 3-O-methyltransferase UbiG [Acuticoccus sp. I52.16.1]UOM35845.1 bifunctional 2-polyprenyl-6-hydroxyphenol methylase/3-demethylubiquinol 3-O-methyltransferase UbiG [Acuticoccus sp. I52.16.1]
MSTIDAAEVDKFDRLAAEWWNPDGKMKPLHKFNPVRLTFLRQSLCRHFERDPKLELPLEGLRIADIGCGGGLLSEPLARMGAEVVGVDAAATNVEVAGRHAAQSGVSVDYRNTTAEAMAAEGETFDAVLAMEIVEHVADVDAFVAACGAMVRPGGLTVFATINRTMKAFALAIVGAEYVLRWLPRGTHQFHKLVRPVELERAFEANGLSPRPPIGVVFNPVRDEWSLGQDTDVNYMVLAVRPGGASANPAEGGAAAL